MNKTDEQRLKELFQQWQDHTLAPQHHDELLSLLERAELEYDITNEMKKIWDETNTEVVFHPDQKEAMLTSIVNYRQPKRFTIWHVMCAAVFLGVILTSIFLIQQPKKIQSVAKNDFSAPVKTADITAPASNKAILTLSDGRQIILENTKEGNVTAEGNVNVVKLKDGQLVYTGNSTEVKWNTLTVPKGSKPISLTLSDGSHVTLNAASSLTYPNAFSGNSRQVSMTGEAYFEITQLHSPGGGTENMPFVVGTNNMSIEVKGTKFNVNAYEDEGSMKTTLIEGKVNIVTAKQQLAIYPGEQAIVTPGIKNEIRLEKHGDIEEAMAWINGKFSFHNADAETVMRQVSRWYDVEVKFAAKPDIRFGGQIDRNSTLRQMLTILQTSGLKFSLNGNVVTIMP